MHLRPLLFALIVAVVVSIGSGAAADGIDEHLNDARSLYHAGHWTDATDAFEKAYHDAEDGTKIKAAAALEWGTLLWEQGSYAEARKLVEESLQIARSLNLDDATGELLSTLGHIQSSMGQLSSAESTLNACIQISTELGDDIHRALCRINRRTVRQLQGKNPGPDEEFQADLETLGGADNELSTGVSLSKTADTYRESGDLDRADQLLGQAGDIYRQLGNVPAQLRNRLRRAQLEHHRQNFDKGAELIDGLLAQFRTMDNRPMIIHTLGLKAEQALHRGDAARAVSYYQQALSKARQIDNPQLTGRAHQALCEMNIADSADHCESAAGLFESTGMVFLEIRARAAHGRALQNRGDYEQARTQYRRAINQMKETVDTDTGPHARSLAFQTFNLCRVNAELGTTGGYGSCARAVRKFDAIDGLDDERPATRAAAAHHAARTAAQADRNDDAINHFRDAADRYADLDEPRHQLQAADILLRLGALKSGLTDHRDDVPDTFERGLTLTEELDLDDADTANTHISLTTQLAQFHLTNNDFDAAIERLEPLVETAQQTGHNSEAAWAYNALARAYLQTDRRDDAVEALEAGLPIAEQTGDEEMVERFRDHLENLTE